MPDRNARRRELASYQRVVRAHEPSAYLHSWRVLGWSGATVYGIYSDELIWLSKDEPSPYEAWKAAANRVRSTAAERIGERCPTT